MPITRDTMRAAAVAFNAAHPGMLADVLSTGTPTGSSITFYRRLRARGIRQLEPLWRSTIPKDGVDDLDHGTVYATAATIHEQQAIEECLSVLRSSGW
jgi:hypothetical protein